MQCPSLVGDLVQRPTQEVKSILVSKVADDPGLLMVELVEPDLDLPKLVGIGFCLAGRVVQIGASKLHQIIRIGEHAVDFVPHGLFQRYCMVSTGSVGAPFFTSVYVERQQKILDLYEG